VPEVHVNVNERGPLDRCQVGGRRIVRTRCGNTDEYGPEKHSGLTKGGGFWQRSGHVISDFQFGWRKETSVGLDPSHNLVSFESSSIEFQIHEAFGA
jgi:hypothetical protein